MDKTISDLINELQQLQIRQQQVLTQLRAAETNNNSDKQENKRNTRITTRSEILDCNGTELKVGDSVRILNKGLFRENTGKVTKLGNSRVSIELTNSKQVTTRKSNNLRLI